MVQVWCYSGHKENERPVRFRIDERDLMVEEIVEQWYGPDGSYFRVRADDGQVYLLRHHAGGEWSVDR